MRVERRGFSRGTIKFACAGFPSRRASVAAVDTFSIHDVLTLIGMLRESAK